jgi:hypothetical protein
MRTYRLNLRTPHSPSTRAGLLLSPQIRLASGHAVGVPAPSAREEEGGAGEGVDEGEASLQFNKSAKRCEAPISH